MKSLKIFLDSHPRSLKGLKISNNPPATQSFLEEIPLYGIEGWLHNEDC